MYTSETDTPSHTCCTCHSKFEVKLDTFDGATINFEQYLSYFENCSELYQWDIGIQTPLLASNLRGQARTFYMSLPVHERRNFQSLVVRLIERFGECPHQSVWVTRLENRRRCAGESVIALGDDLRQLAQKAYADLDQRAHERLALNQLYRLISPDMLCRCIDCQCETVNEAVSLIDRYEAVIGSTDLQMVSEFEALKTGPILHVGEYLPQMEERLKRLERKSVTPTYPVMSVHGNPQRQRVCFLCNSAEHLCRQCPLNSVQYRGNAHECAMYASSAESNPNNPPHTPSTQSPNTSHTRERPRTVLMARSVRVATRHPTHITAKQPYKPPMKRQKGRTRQRAFRVGDAVFVRKVGGRQGVSLEMASHGHVRFMIAQKCDDLTYVIKRVNRKQSKFPRRK